MYKPPLIFKEKHLSTILPSLFRKPFKVNYVRKRFNTPDGDFFDVDCLENKSLDKGFGKAIVLLHGLEGSSSQHYMTSQAKQFFEEGYDIFAVNFRTCSGVMNKTSKLYHSGFTEDLELVIKELSPRYKAISLIGFSLGGNVILKFLGENQNLVKKIERAAVFSVPLDLESCAYELEKGISRIYCREFMRTLSVKAEYIQEKFIDSPIKNVDTKKLKSFLDYDELVTAPLFDFKSARDYWTKSSSLPVLSKISVPTLIMNALNDPFLGKGCYPRMRDIGNENLSFEFPKYGGHVGFSQKKLSDYNLMDIKAKNFILEASSC